MAEYRSLRASRPGGVALVCLIIVCMVRKHCPLRVLPPVWPKTALVCTECLGVNKVCSHLYQDAYKSLTRLAAALSAWRVADFWLCSLVR